MISLMNKQPHSHTNKRSLYLRECAQQVCDQLAIHPVLKQYWARISVILKGSAARGNADGLSDIDLVLYCDESTRTAIIGGYRLAGMTQRSDGILMFFAGKGYDGHYHVESFDQLRHYFNAPDFIHVWEYQQVILLCDPSHRFRNAVLRGTRQALGNPMIHIKRAYLNLQLDLDWLRHPLKRGDGLSVYLHCAQLTRGFICISYLLDGKPYPPDKWSVHYLSTTRFGKRHNAQFAAYAHSSATSTDIPCYLDLSCYPLYTDAQKLVGQLERFTRKHYGNQPWLSEWYKYV